jgi:formate hydrogenlyase subunit 3/multisubunit Na+/H+ antiporter MnhD subunit
MAELVLSALIILPLIASALCLPLQRARPSLSHALALAATGLTLFAALALLPYAERNPSLVITWLPGTGAMELVATPAKLYILLATVGSAFLALLSTAAEEGEYPPLSRAVLLLALGAANAAFLAEHFLARYVALEMVALCVPLALVAEAISSAGMTPAWNSYLLLRLGDAGLLAAILILRQSSGTLQIGPALQGAEGLGAGALGAAVAGLLLAVWVKMGGWPFHLWAEPGRRLTLASQGWLYAILVPNLGIYLLYRVAPLLAISSAQAIILWLGAGGAALAMLIALLRSHTRDALVYLGASQAGLLLFIAAAGPVSALWLSLIALTPLRLLLFLANDLAQRARSPVPRQVAAGCFALGGLALAAFGFLLTGWAREAGAPLDALLLLEGALALTAVWTAVAARRLTLTATSEQSGTATAPRWPQWLAAGLLVAGVVAGGLLFAPLTRHLAGSGGLKLPPIPTLPRLLLYGASAPASLTILVCLLLLWQLRRRLRLGSVALPESVGQNYNLEEGLTRAGQALRAIVEEGILEQLIALTARATVDGARFAYRFVEQDGLEGLLRHAVQAVLAGSRALQRRHTGRLRLNLFWVAASLLLAAAALVIIGW